MTAAAPKNATPATTAAPQQTAPKPPAGFQSASMPDIDAWYNPTPGMVLYGTIVGAIKIPDDKSNTGYRDAVLVQLKEPITAVKEQQPVKLEAGQVIGVGIRHQLGEMLYYVEHRGDVWCLAKDKVSIGHGQTMWKFDLHFKGKKSNPPERHEAAGPSGGVPF